jgi:hypothetical protein
MMNTASGLAQTFGIEIPVRRHYSRKEYMNICSVELFLRKLLTGGGHFFLALAGSRLMPLINN